LAHILIGEPVPTSPEYAPAHVPAKWTPVRLLGPNKVPEQKLLWRVEALLGCAKRPFTT